MFNCIILGAAGRDFHDFQTFFRRHPEFRVRAFTAAQIPFIETRSFPRELAGPEYDADIPIFPESDLANLIEQFQVDFVFLAYSDLSYGEVMQKASLVQACGASFAMLGPRHTQLKSNRPVIAVTAVRTGAGKSPLSQWLAGYLSALGRRVGVLRHPMPYGDLVRQAVGRFAAPADLQRFQCTIEEREEYEPYLEQGLAVFGGVDYRRILTAAEAESDVILWDGGNNDTSFIHPDLSFVVADALRAGHEVQYYPGEVNFRTGDVIVMMKVAQAPSDDLRLIRAHAQALNPNAEMIEADLEIDVANPSRIAGRRVLVVEDGPTLTHGGMPSGAGLLAALRFRAAEVIDPRPFAVGTIADAYRRFPHLKQVLPALGYSAAQCRELAETIAASGADAIVDASPARLDRLIPLKIPVVRVRYKFSQTAGTPIAEIVRRFLDSQALESPSSHARPA